MKVSVIVPTYKRAWSLPYLLDGLANQSVKPNEVIIILKPSGDGSEDVIRQYMNRLNIKLIIQERGLAIDAYDTGIREAKSDLVLFTDDDGIPHPDWVKRYIELFSELENAGGISGLWFSAFLVNNKLVLSNEPQISEIRPAKRVFYRKPLKELEGYCHWFSISGIPSGEGICNGPIIKTIIFGGVNMGFRREAIEGLNLAKLYRGSRRGSYFEYFMAYYVVRRGFDAYMVIDPSLTPVVWHIQHTSSLSRKPGFWTEFWRHFDRASLYFRLRRLGANVSFPAYLVASLVLMRKRMLPRLLATAYAILYNTLYVRD